MDYFKIIGGVQTPRIGEKTINVAMSFSASDILCKAMALTIDSWKNGSHDPHDIAVAIDMQKEIIKAWEAFRP